MNLRDLQRGFFASLTGAGTLDGVDERGMRVYANNYRGQLVDALRDTYAKTLLWLGNDAFDTAAEQFIEVHVPSSWTLDAYGEALTGFLDARYPDDPEVAELAWLDWTLRRAFAGADAPAVLAMDGLASDDWERVEFEFVSTLRFCRVRSNAVAIWRALAEESTPPAARRLDAVAGMRVWRAGLSPQFCSMEEKEGDCLDLALAGGSFGELCELLARRLGNELVAEEAGALLRSWVGDGLIVRLRQG